MLTRRHFLAGTTIGFMPLDRAALGQEAQERSDPWRLRFIARDQFIKGVDIAAPQRNFAAASFGLPAARLSALQVAHFNTLRCFISFSDFMKATTSTVMSACLEKWIGHIRHITDAGFKALVSWDSTYEDRIKVCDGGPNTAQFEFVLASLAEAIAAHFQAEQVALELMNEPPNDSDMPAGRSWNQFVGRFFRAARKAHAALSIVVQPSELAYTSSLPKLPVSDFDANTIYSFHWYSPAGFTHQSAGSPAHYPNLYRVPYLVSKYPGGQAQMIADMKMRVIADAALSDSQKAAQIAVNSNEIDGFFYRRSPLGTPPLKAGSWSGLLKWLADNPGIHPKQVMLGEFGVNGDFNPSTGTRTDRGGLGADLTSRCEYMRDARQAVEGKEWGGWVVHQAMGDFNIFQQTSYVSHGNELIPEIVNALFD